MVELGSLFGCGIGVLAAWVAVVLWSLRELWCPCWFDHQLSKEEEAEDRRKRRISSLAINSIHSRKCSHVKFEERL